VGGGALWGDVDHETQAFGLVAPGGVVSDTGVGGLTLGGGYGWVRRKYGMSIDALAEAQVVCADGQVRTASAESNPELFWALRGGGGNFGVVTSFTFDLQPLGPIVAFAAAFYPAEDTAEVLRGWRAYVADAPDEVTTEVVSLTFPASADVPEVIHGRAVTLVGGVYAGEAEDGLRAMAPLRELGSVLFDQSGPAPFTAVQAGFDPLFPRNMLRAYWKSQYLDQLSDIAIDVIAERTLDRPAPLTLVNTLHLGGAIARVPPHATAFSERSSPFMVSFDGMWTDPADDETLTAWVRRAWDAVRPYGNGCIYRNFTGRDREPPESWIDPESGRNLARLATVKATYDPDNVFRHNDNVLVAK
jgi:FAD/FMN-containing dehydrogenase